MVQTKQSLDRHPSKGRSLVDVFEISRHWISDRSDTLQPALVKTILGHIRAKDWRWLVGVGSDDELAKQGAQAYVTLSQLRSFFKKNSDFADPKVCEAKARENFFRAEKLCRITNRRIDHYSRHEDRLSPDLREMVQRVRATLARTCGDVDVWREGIPRNIKITSGATASTPRKRSLPYMKIRKTYRATVGAHPYVDALVKFHSGKSPRLVQVLCNRIALVPKDSLTYRTIAAEPEGNLPFQLSIDAYWKRQLRLVGIDLSDQRSNQRWARIGSLDGSVATIDLSMASDTVALNTVLWLFPDDWVKVLMALRTPAYKGPFGYGLYSKFSSMGNGYTFALETMLFYAIVKASGSHVCSVYGDDIICDASSYDTVVRLLRFLGFVPNERKSFAAGPFRESCGSDYFNGVSVRPFFMRAAPEGKHELCHLINGLLSVGNPGGKLWEYCRGVARRERLPIVPWNGSTQSGIHIHPTDAGRVGKLRVERGVDVFRGYSVKDKSMPSRDVQGNLLWSLRAVTERSPGGSETCIRPFALKGDWSVNVRRCAVLAERSHIERDAIITSDCPSNRTSVRLGNLVWHMPDGERPVHLYLVADYLLAKS